MMDFRYIIGILIAVLSGCANLAPEYIQPERPVSQTWSQHSAINDEPEVSLLLQEMGWHDFFTEQRLNSVINLALENNRDLRIAALNIQKLRAQYQIQRANQYPTINASIGSSAQGLSSSQSSTGLQSTVHEYSAGLGFSAYEIDFFGRINNLQTAAFESYLSTQHAHRSVQISLVGEVANTYLTLTSNKQKLLLTEYTLEAQTVSHQLIQRKYDLGALSELALKQSSIQVEAAKVELSGLKILIEANKNALVFLVGKQIPEDLLPIAGMEVSLKQFNIPVNLSSDVLLKRPDVMAAEHKLRATHANIGAAKAVFYPRITLTTHAGLASDSLSGLFDSGTSTWGVLPKIVIPIFDSQRNKSNLEVAETEQAIAMAHYEKTIQTAFREVADVLSKSKLIHEQLDAQHELTLSARDAYRLSKLRFNQGADSYLAVLDSQRFLYSAQQALVQLQLSKISSQVNLYKTLGGGIY